MYTYMKCWGCGRHHCLPLQKHDGAKQHKQEGGEGRLRNSGSSNWVSSTVITNQTFLAKRGSDKNRGQMVPPSTKKKIKTSMHNQPAPMRKRWYHRAAFCPNRTTRVILPLAASESRSRILLRLSTPALKKPMVAAGSIIDHGQLPACKK